MLLLSILCIGATPPHQAPPVRFTYSEVRSMVASGKSIVLSVGMDFPGSIRCDEAMSYGINPGIYDCWFENGRPVMLGKPVGTAVIQNVTTSTPIDINNQKPVINYIRNIGSAVIGQS